MSRIALVLCALALALPGAAAAKTPPMTGYGAPRAVFLAHHKLGPMLKVAFAQGDALHVVVRFDPAVPEAAALRSVAKLLPADAKRLRLVDRPACLQVVYGSQAFATQFLSAIWVELKSAKGTYRPSAVSSATLDTANADTVVPC